MKTRSDFENEAQEIKCAAERAIEAHRDSSAAYAAADGQVRLLEQHLGQKEQEWTIVRDQLREELDAHRTAVLALKRESETAAEAARQAHHRAVQAHQRIGVFALRAGKVIQAGPTEAGLVVRVEHPEGDHTHYGHFTAIVVEEGQSIDVDDVIGWH